MIESVYIITFCLFCVYSICGQPEHLSLLLQGRPLWRRMLPSISKASFFRAVLLHQAETMPAIHAVAQHVRSVPAQCKPVFPFPDLDVASGYSMPAMQAIGCVCECHLTYSSLSSWLCVSLCVSCARASVFALCQAGPHATPMPCMPWGRAGMCARLQHAVAVPTPLAACVLLSPAHLPL